MPEGPEIRRAADQIEHRMVGCRLVDAWFAFPHLRPYGGELTGQRLEGLETHGKAMLFRFSNGLYLYTHNLLWGKWYFTRHGQLPKTNRQLRVALHTEEDSALLYSASEIQVLTEDEVKEHPFLRRIGPDVLKGGLTPAVIADRLQSERFRRRGFAGLLLDQAFLSGIGNYLRCEALFLARLHPSGRVGDCTRRQLLALGRALLETARRGYEHGGVTVNPKHLKKGVKARHYVFRRGGEPCLLCGAPVMGEVLNGRPLFHCPTCQPSLKGVSPA